MALAQPLSHETVISRTENELAFQNYPLPVVSHQQSAVSNNNLRTYIPPTTSDFINRSSFNIINKKNEHMQLNIREIEKAPLYHTYPRIEHVTSTHTEIIKERVIEKEDRTPHATPQLPSIDLNRLTDQIYPLLERKVRIERERRGL
jgi:D-hexose-6-phosphate mutarotase